MTRNYLRCGVCGQQYGPKGDPHDRDLHRSIVEARQDGRRHGDMLGPLSKEAS